MSNVEEQSTPYERWGCPMDDSTLWRQSDSGDSFVSPDGIATAASWLPCLFGSKPPLPGMCENCELYHAGLTRLELSPSVDGS